MTDNTPHDVYAMAKRWLQTDAYSLSEFSIRQTISGLTAEVVRLHDTLMAWRDMLRRQIAVDERDLDETWLEAGEVVERLTGILAGEGLD